MSHAALVIVAALTVAPLLDNVMSLDPSHDRRGADYVHDLVDSAPDGALVLLKSDMASQAAIYACGVEARCGSRIVLTPGQLWMPWKRAELSRRYPSLSLPPVDAPSPARWLVENNVQARPVWIHPELVDEVVRGGLSSLPSLLLFRVYPDDKALRSDLPRFRAALDDLMQGRTCEACPYIASGKRITGADVQLARIYDAAMLAHATAAAQLEWPAEADALRRWRRRALP
jgi:hypothetical protein